MKDLIGIFDTGVGGISVLKEAVRLLPNENFLFYGDNKNAPYGRRPVDEIRELSEQVVNYLLDQDIKAMVIACNTITSAYASILREHVKIPVIGMEPAVKPASLARSGGLILAMATHATLTLEKFHRLMALYGEGVIPLEGKGLVEIVENGKIEAPETMDVLAELFQPYLNRQVDGIVLGCTHYPFLRRQISSFFPHAQIFDGREGTIHQLQRRLQQENLLTRQTVPGNVRFETSGTEDTLTLMRTLFAREL